MSIAILDQPEIRRAVVPFSVEQYHRFSEAGLVAEDTELLRGAVLKKMTKSPLHSYVVDLLLELFKAVLSPHFFVRKEEPLTLADSEPEPDVSVVDGSRSDYLASHPTTAHLVVEVAVATLAIDRQKAAIYSEAGVAEYWIVIPAARRVEIYTNPTAQGYQNCRTAEAEDGRLTSKAFPQLDVDLASLFP